MFVLPFVPGVVEIVRKRDADSLFIAMDLARDPRYFGKSFKQMLHRAVAQLPAGAREGEVTLSKREAVRISESLEIDAAAEMENLMMVRGDLRTAEGVRCVKEVYVAGHARVGAANTLHVLACDGDVSIGPGTVVERWLDAGGDLAVAAECRLGISATCGGRLHLSGPCSFRRLYGMPVATGRAERGAVAAASAVESRETATSAPVRSRERTIGGKRVLEGDVVFLKDVRIGHHAVVNGGIRCYGDLIVEENVAVHGNIFADGDISIGEGVVVSGHIFSQGTVTIARNSIVSRPGVVKSIIGKRAVRLAPDVVVYGYISTEGAGEGCFA
jgi:predicted acyltransferase (DUF342 family)